MRLSVKSSPNTTRLYIVDSYRDSNNKVITYTYKKCGELSELKKLYKDPIKHFTEEAKKLTEERKKENSPLIVTYNQTSENTSDRKISNIGYLFLQKIYYDLGLDKTCTKIMEDNKAEYDLTKILKDLVFSRVLYPSSKLSTFELAKNYIEQPNYQLHDIYRALDLLSNNIDLIQKEVYKNSPKVCKRNTNILYYDCTNYFFEIEQQDGFRNYGISKEHRPNPIVQMGLFMDGNGIPLAFNINPGNQSEQLSLRPTEEMIEKEFGLSKFIYCSDAGLGSYNNKWFNQLKDRSFIITQSLKKLKGYILDWALDDSSWENGTSIDECNEDTILYKSRPIKEKGNIVIEKEALFDDEEKEYINTQVEINQRIIVTYSPKYAAYQKRIREEQLLRANKLINKPSAFNKYSSTDCKRFIKNISYDKNGEIINKDLSLDLELIQKEARFDGFYALVTNLDDNDEEIIKINHNRWEIEESFRIMKTDFKARPVYLQNENRIKAHFLTCYLALLVFRILEQKVNTDETHFSASNIINTLKNMNLFKLKDVGYASAYPSNSLQEKLCSVFDMDINKEAYRSSKLKKIISSSKN